MSNTHGHQHWSVATLKIIQADDDYNSADDTDSAIITILELFSPKTDDLNKGMEISHIPVVVCETVVAVVVPDGIDLYHLAGLKTCLDMEHFEDVSPSYDLIAHLQEENINT